MVLINSTARVFRDSVERDKHHIAGECRRVSADSGKRLGWRVGRLSAAGTSVADALLGARRAGRTEMASGANGAKGGLEPVALAARGWRWQRHPGINGLRAAVWGGVIAPPLSAAR